MNPTFSELPRAFRCRLSTVLPRVDEETAYRSEGTARHRFLQRVTELSAAPSPRSLREAWEQALAEAPASERMLLAAIQPHGLQLDGVAAEVAYEIDCSPGRAHPEVLEIGRGINRQYPSPGENSVVGTVDRVALIEPDGAYVGDYKGRGWVGEPAEDEQMLAAALSVMAHQRRRYCEIEVIPLIDGVPYPKRARIETIDRDRFYFRLQDLVQRVHSDRVAASTGALPEAQRGPWCTWCPSFRYCPAQFALARAALSGEHGLLDMVTGKIEALDAPGAATLYSRAKAVEKVLQVVQAAVSDYARTHSFPLNDGTGRWYGLPPGAEEREIVDGEKAAEAVEILLGEEAGKKARKVKVTFEGIESAVRAWLELHPDRKQKGALSQGVRELESALKEQGLIRVSNNTVVRPFKPKAVP